MDVKIYTTPTCVWCKKTKEFFREHNVKYKEIDVSSDEQAAHEMIQKTGQLGVPVVEIDNNIVIGYDMPKLKKFLHLN
jgi:glutaredoxin-like YruB-family protein